MFHKRARLWLEFRSHVSAEYRPIISRCSRGRCVDALRGSEESQGGKHTCQATQSQPKRVERLCQRGETSKSHQIRTRKQDENTKRHNLTASKFSVLPLVSLYQTMEQQQQQRFVRSKNKGGEHKLRNWQNIFTQFINLLIQSDRNKSISAGDCSLRWGADVSGRCRFGHSRSEKRITIGNSLVIGMKTKSRRTSISLCIR